MDQFPQGSFSADFWWTLFNLVVMKQWLERFSTFEVPVVISSQAFMRKFLFVCIWRWVKLCTNHYADNFEVEGVYMYGPVRLFVYYASTRSSTVWGRILILFLLHQQTYCFLVWTFIPLFTFELWPYGILRI